MPETNAGDELKKVAKHSELETLIRARYPVVYVSSWEEMRVIQELDDISSRLGKALFVWTINDGIRPFKREGGLDGEGRQGTKDPLMALREIAQKPEPAIYVLKDFHAFINEAAIKRALRDLAGMLQASLKSVVILSPTVDIPLELEKDITIVDYPLPSRRHMRQLLKSIASDLENNPQLKVDLSNGAQEAIVDAAVGLTLHEAENVIAKTLVAEGQLTAKEAPLIYSEKEQIIRKTGLLEYIRIQEDFGGIGGLDQLKEWLAKRQEGFTKRARDFGLPAPKGVLMLGVQGCGKSLCAKAVPKLWSLPLLRLDMGELFGSLVGESETNVRRAIKLAESVAPVVLWIDEIDKGFSGIESSAYSDSGTTARVFGSILTWLQEKTSSVFVIATANNVEVLPPELLRKGRFDEIFFVDLPTLEERMDIFKIHLDKRRRPSENYDVQGLAKQADGFSGAEIEQAIVSALFDAFYEEKELETRHIIAAIDETVPLSKLMAEEIDSRRRWADGRTRPAS